MAHTHMQTQTNGKKRILILTADAGFGHRSAAKAITEALQEMHPQDCEIETVNPLNDERVPRPLRKSGEDYDRLVRVMPGLYKLEYDMADSAATSAMVNSALSVILFEVMNDLVKQYQPHAIVTPYPLYQAPLAAVFALTQRDIPLLTVVTDLAPVHRLWFHKAADLCMVSMPAVREQAIEAGLPPENVAVTGIPVRPGLTKNRVEKSVARAQLGWLPDRTTLLAVGSKRVKNLPGILQALNHSALPLQMAVVTGGDEGLYNQLKELEWHLPVHVYNFVEDMSSMMHAADFVMCKAGGLIVTESLACGLPILLTDAIEGQETSNAHYVVAGGAGEMAVTPLEGLQTVYHWLANEGEVLRVMSQNAQMLGFPNSAYDAASLIWEAAQLGAGIKTDRRFIDFIDRFIQRLQRENLAQSPPSRHL